MKRQLCSLIVCIPLINVAQSNSIDQSRLDNKSNIQWIEGLKWQQVKQKARLENKYIFVDCFATWCGPCKKMDKEVYTNDTIIKFFNDKFISVKVQMDKTSHDDQFVQSWYEDAISLNKQYRILGYPSFLFFSPNGTITDKEMGFQSVGEMLSLAKAAIEPGKKYQDPFEEYNALVDEYNKGIQHFEKMPYMIQTAFKLGENDFGKKLLDDHSDYVSHLKRKQRYTKENIKLWTDFVLSSNKKRFWFFFRDRRFINKVMHQKGYAEQVVDKTILYEIIWPFFKEQSAGSNVVMSLETMNLSNPYQKPDSSEANWQQLSKTIRSKFGKRYALRNVFEAKILWYNRHKNFNMAAIYSLKKIKKYPPSVSKEQFLAYLNDVGWSTFLNVTESETLNETISLFQKNIKDLPDSIVGDAMLDTYANLLYKVGKKIQAIEIEKRAVAFCEVIPELKMMVPKYQETIERMKSGEPTYIKEGAIWK